MVNSESCTNGMKLTALIIGGLSLELMIIFIILKVDGKSAVSHWNWMVLLVIPLAVTLICGMIWVALHYYVTLANQSSVDTTNAREYIKNRNQVNVYSIESYAETSVFRDILLLTGYLMFMVLGVMLYITPCKDCNTPYQMLAIGATVTYGIRSILLLYHLFEYYAHYKNMTKEVYKYQHEFDKLGEYRMFHEVIPKLYLKNTWTWGALIDGGVFLTTVTFAVLGTLWIQGNECASKCTRRFRYAGYLLMGMYFLEGLYILTLLLLRFYKRATGVEALQEMFNTLKEKRDEQLKAEMDEKKVNGTIRA